MAKGMCGSHYYQYRKGQELRPIREAGQWGPWEKTTKGYIRRRRTLPDGTRDNQWQHRYVFEAQLGRPLRLDEEIHHKDGNRSNNNLDNLELWSTSQPKGQRGSEKRAWAIEIMELYSTDDELIEYALEVINLYAPQRLE